jgi:hypothetical protein
VRSLITSFSGEGAELCRLITVSDWLKWLPKLTVGYDKKKISKADGTAL